MGDGGGGGGDRILLLLGLRVLLVGMRWGNSGWCWWAGQERKEFEEHCLSGKPMSS